jgi:hypothetical protein
MSESSCTTSPDLGEEQQRTQEEISTPSPNLGEEQQRTQEEISTKIKSFPHNKLNEFTTQNHRGHHPHSLISLLKLKFIVGSLSLN